MRRRSTRRKPLAADLPTNSSPEALDSPYAKIRSVRESPEEFDFSLNTAKLQSSPVSMRKKSNRRGSASNLFQPNGSLHSTPPPPPLKGVNTVSDLKQLASSQLESLKRQLERSHVEISKEIEASNSRLQKRFKIQTQACQQVMDEADMDYKKMQEQTDEGREAMNASFAKFMAEVQAGAARMCKTSIPDISKSFEMAINSLRGRYVIPSTPL